VFVSSGVFVEWCLSEGGSLVPTLLYKLSTFECVDHSPLSIPGIIRGSVTGLAGLALVGPLFRKSLVSFPDCIDIHVLLNTYILFDGLWEILLASILGI